MNVPPSARATTGPWPQPNISSTARPNNCEPSRHADPAWALPRALAELVNLFGPVTLDRELMRRPHLPPDRLLDRRGLRWFVSLRRSVMISLAQRRVCIVRRRNGIDSIRYRNGMIVPFSMLRTPEQLEDRAAIFLRAYRPKPGDIVVDAGAGIGDEFRCSPGS